MEPFTLDAPQGVLADGDVLKGFSATAHSLGVSKENAQELLNKVAPIVQERLIAQVEDMRAKFADETSKHPELGGAKLAANRALVQRAIAEIAPAGLVELLQSAGIDNHPLVFELLVNAGAKLAPDAAPTHAPTAHGGGDPLGLKARYTTQR